MAGGKNKYQSREDRLKIRQVLMEEWDPIGVREFPEAYDEYDSYVGEVYTLLMERRASQDEIADFLYRVAIERMSLPPSTELSDLSSKAAKRLVDVRPSFELH
jgi:hypothetical protein